MSRIIRFAAPGGPEVLTFEDVVVPEAGPGEVRIQVKAIGINRAEAMFREDAYIESPHLPARLGYEASGVIDSMGDGVTGFALGDVVSTIPAFSMNQYGMYGEVVLAPVHAVVKHPPSLSHEEAASIWMMFVTAYGALIESARLTPQDVVLIPAASSSVGLAAIQIVNLVGATPVALTRTRAKRQALLEAGARHVIVTDEEDLVAEVMKITHGEGARVIFDPVGGATFLKLMEVLTVEGIILLYGALGDGATTIPVLDFLAKRQTIRAHNIGQTSGDPSRLKEAVRYVLDGFASGALKPVIDRVFSFDEMVEVHRYLEANGQFGKVVVTV
jgi:NADPH:quinone reductase-like Zn-dependent oxidoreductase